MKQARSLSIIQAHPVIASKVKQSPGPPHCPANIGVTQPMDCFVARAPRNDGERLFLSRSRTTEQDRTLPKPQGPSAGDENSKFSFSNSEIGLSLFS
jgi:hypothetical protein